MIGIEDSEQLPSSTLSLANRLDTVEQRVSLTLFPYANAVVISFEQIPQGSLEGHVTTAGRRICVIFLDYD